MGVGIAAEEAYLKYPHFYPFNYKELQQNNTFLF